MSQIFASPDNNANNEVKEFNNQQFCVCCLAQNVKFIKLSTCKHTGFIAYYFKYKMEIQKSVVCYLCHSTLKKIDWFKDLIQESSILLNKNALNEKIYRSQFKYSPIEVQSIFPEAKSDNQNAMLGTDLTVSNDFTEISVDIKKEYNTNIFEIENIYLKEEESNFDNREDCVVTLPIEENVKEEAVEIKVKRGKEVKKEDTNESLQRNVEIFVLNRQQLEMERKNLKTEENYVKRPYKCDKCLVGYDYEINLKLHLEKKHNQSIGAYKCSVCESIYNTELSLKAHEKRHFMRYKCKVCGKQYADERSVLSHCAERHGLGGVNNYSCNFEGCGFKSQSHRAYTYHLSRHRQEPCVHCGKLYLKGTQMRLHVNNVHNNMSAFKCELCDKQYRQRAGLTLHMQSAHESDPAAYFCTHCRTQFRTARTLAQHMQQHSTHVGKKYMCDECGTRFVSKANLKYHIQGKHFTTTKYQCGQCSKVLGTARSLKRHEEFVHQKKRPPKDKICDHCGKAFRTAFYLMTHIRTHTGERPHVCKHCGAKFAHPASLYNHNKLVHSERKEQRTRRRTLQRGSDTVMRD